MTATPAPRVGVVIVNFNAGAFIGRTLRTLAAQTVPAARVVVVDNASTDGSDELVGRVAPDAQLVRMGHNAGFARANNEGIRRLDDCEWIALLNPDAYPEPDWLEHLLAGAAAHPDFHFFASRMLRASDPSRLDGTGDVYHVSGVAFRRDHGVPVVDVDRSQPEEVIAACAAAALFRRTDLEAVGGFDEHYFAYLEDVDLALRLRLLGRRCLFLPEATVLHEGSATTGYESDFTLFLSHRNLVWTWIKTLPAPLLWRHSFQFLLLNVAIVAWFAVRGRYRPLLDAKRAALRQLPRVLEQRRALQRDSVVDVAQLNALLDRSFTTPYVTAVNRIVAGMRGQR